MSEVILKPKRSLYTGMQIGGGFIAMLGWYAMDIVGGWYAAIPGVFTALGLIWLLIATLMLNRRDHMAIRLSHDGIELPGASLFGTRSRRVPLPRSEIESVSKSESVKGRGISILMKNGGSGFVHVRNYCDIDEFLDHCKTYEIPVA